jgi:hypothetical protein
MEQPPHPMRLGDTDKDYYVGALTNPGTSAGAERAPWATNEAGPLPKPGLSVGGATPLPKPGPSVGGATEAAR